MHASSTQSVNILEIFNAYQYRIYKLDFCSNNFHIFRFSPSGIGEVDVYRFISKNSLDHYVRSCLDPGPCHEMRYGCVIMHEIDGCKDRF